MKLKKALASILALVLLVSCMSITAFAEDTSKQLTVNDGTTTNGYVPYSGLYGDVTSQEVQFIQPAADLAAMKGSKITKMTFYVSPFTESLTTTFDVRVAEIDSTTFDSSLKDVSTATKVYTGTVSPTDNKVEITFTTPFEYKGGNLLVDFQLETKGNFKNIFFYGVTASYYSSRYEYYDYSQHRVNQSFLPKVTFDYTVSSYALTASSSLTQGNVTFKVGDTAVTSAKPGDVVTATATGVADYLATLSSADVEFTTNKDGVATFTMPAKAVTVTATYSNGCYLDLDTTTTDIPDSKDIAQTYTFTESGDTTYTDASKVKVEWTVTNIGATYTGTKTWNPDEMKWVEAKAVTAADHTAEFKLTNYSSEKVNASVTFKAEDALAATLTSATFKNNDTDVTGKTVTLDTPVTKDKDTYADSDFTAKAQTVTATLVFDKAEFAKLSATTAETTYGTYTVKLGAASATLITFTPVTALANYEDANVSILESNIVLSGNTWADVIAANSGNTIKFTYSTYTLVGTLSTDDDGDVVIKAPSPFDPNYTLELLYLTSADLTGTNDYQLSEDTAQYCVESTATASDTVYFALAGS